MDIYAGENGETPVPSMVKNIGGIAGQAPCIECNGMNTWHFHPDGRVRPCPDCKGTGKFL